ncbi:MAG: competence/damage-inducible protein A [Vicingaceae bacterium]
MEAELITIGDEILIGQTIDTNSAWMAKQLYELGINISRITSIKDEKAEIISALTEASTRSKLVLLTGGLGPTKDDITKKVLCDFFETELVRNKAVEEKIEEYFNYRGRQILETNLQQADLPKDCVVLHNELGTASGMWFEKNGTVVVSMPGVPYEMKGLMSNEVLPKVKQHFTLSKLYHKTIMTEGIGESFLAEIVKDWENSLEIQGIKIAYLPSPGMVRVRLSAAGGDYTELKNKVDKKAKELNTLVPQYIFGEDDIAMEKAIGDTLLAKQKTVATAESCTGGNIAKLLTSVPGSSVYFLGSIVSYSNAAKTNLLGVDSSDIENYGAVSETVVRQMAIGARKKLNADYAIATTGVAGPDGGTEEKPVGTVWIAVAAEAGVFAKKFQFEKDRGRNILRSSLAGISMLRRLLEGNLELN